MKNSDAQIIKPFKYLAYSEKTNSIIVLSFLIPQIILLITTRSYANLLVILTTVSASMAVELLSTIKAPKRSFSFINAAIAGMLTGLFLPATFPLAAAFLICLISLYCCRRFIGGFGDCWLNTAAITVCMCWLLGAGLFPSYQITGEILLTRNPALELIQNGTFPIISADTRITASLNKLIFSWFGVSIPEGYVSLFWDTHSLIPAFRFNFITLLTSIVLISFDIIKPLVPGLFLLVYGLLVHFAGPLFYSGSPGQGDLILAMCTSGVLISALFMLQTAGTTPMTSLGKAIYAVFGGILAFFIIGAGTSPAGSVFTVICMNLFSPFIQKIERWVELRKIRNQMLETVKELKEGTNA